nr:MAG TPA: hypothetical protein [Caudoviricetes sp.]
MTMLRMSAKWCSKKDRRHHRKKIASARFSFFIAKQKKCAI